MNDPTTPTPDGDDDLLRHALQSEAEGVQATDELLDRTLAAARRPVVRPYRRLLAAAAIAAIAIGAGVVLTGDDGQNEVNAVDDPTATTDGVSPDELRDLLNVGLWACDSSIALEVYVDADATEEQLQAIEAKLEAIGPSQPLRIEAEAVRARLLDQYADDPDAVGVIEASPTPTAVLMAFVDHDAELQARGEVSDLPGVRQVISTDCTIPPTPTGERPTLVALVREDGWLVVVDLDTGEERELHFGGDPGAPPSGQEEGGPQLIDAVDLSPDGQWVYFSTCCEPASGVTYRIPVGGGEPEVVVYGAHPRLSPDGELLATVTGEAVQITTVDGNDLLVSETSCCTRRLAWSPDGSQLAAVRSTGAQGEVPQVVLFDWDGASLTAADPGKPDNPGFFVAWGSDGMLTTIGGGGSVDSSRSLSQDAGYQWLLWVDGEGVVREQAGLTSGELPAIAGLPEALAADW